MSEPITVTVANLETALRDWLAGFDYDLHKATECGEEDGTDSYPDEAAALFARLRANEASPIPPSEQRAHLLGEISVPLETRLRALGYAEAADEIVGILRDIAREADQ